MNAVRSAINDRTARLCAALRRSIGVLWVAAAVPAGAQEFPTKPIRLIVPFGAGTTADIIARTIGASLNKDFGQSVVIDNRPGAAGTVGAELVARATNDGYTLVLGTIASHGIGPLMFPVRYNPVNDFAPITLIANSPNLLVVHRAIPVTTPAQLIEYAKKAGTLNFTSAGTATTSHLAGELLRLKQGAPLAHVAYRQGGQALTDVLSGQIPVMIWQPPPLRPHIASGALKAVAALSAARISSFPNVPTISETLIPGFDSNAWFGILAPAGTPRRVIDRLHQAILAALETAELRHHFSVQGLEPAVGGPEAFSKQIPADLAKWREVIQAAGVKAE